MRFATEMLQRRCLVCAVAAFVAFPVSNAGAATLSIPDVPLFLTTGSVDPNVMLMLDSSGSMSNVVPDAPYDEGNEYSCTGTLFDANDQVDIEILENGDPYLRRSGTSTTYDWGRGNNKGLTNKSKRCFDPDATYRARLFADGGNNNGTKSPGSYLPARYTGNYLNWYFGTNGSNIYNWQAQSFGWRSRIKPGAKVRLTIAQSAASTLIDGMPANMRVGLSRYNNNDGGQLLETVAALTTDKRGNLKTKVSGIQASGSTPLAETLSDIGYYFSRQATKLTLHPSEKNPKTVSRSDVFNNGYKRHASWDTGPTPVEYSCQRSFAVLLTDGRPHEDRNISSHLADYDGDCATAGANCDTYDRKRNQDYESAGSDYLNDVAMALYEMDLRPDLENDLGTKNNLATYLISFADYDANNDPLMPSTAKQGGGQYFSTGNETELVAAFRSALDSIVKQGASAASAAVNSGSIGDSTRIFQAKFDSADWSGKLLSYLVKKDGTLGSLQWDAASKLPSPADRDIITVDSAGAAVAFTAQQLKWDFSRMRQLDPAYTVVNPNLANATINYLRGDATDETSARKFRARQTKLGDIINSSPIVVGAPSFSYRDDLEAKPHSKFRIAQKDRDEVVYVGANDGMLHAFDVDTGRELLAFIPTPVFGKLRTLTNPSYAHRFFVDGSPNAGDVYINNNWHTVLVGGLNQGGQGIYALNITDPRNFNQDQPGRVFAWEFTDRDDGIEGNGITGDADLGYTHSQPAIVRLQNGKWAAIFGNGYNNTEIDGSASATGNAVLYIVDIADGRLLRKLDTGVGAAQDPLKRSRPNGLATPAVVDVNGDAKVDYVYAGDLRGNLWKFDIRATDRRNWKVAYSSGADAQPLFTARHNKARVQPITSRPEVIRGPRGVGMMVLFGTGKYLETTDTAIDSNAPEVQSYYGLFDRNTGGRDDLIADSDELIEQTIKSEKTSSGGKNVNVRITSQNEVGKKRGWYLNLLSPSGYDGERVVSNAVVRAGRVIFTTLIPDNKPCGFGGTSWLMELDALSGTRLATTPFDVNNDGVIDGEDMIDNEPASGLQRPDSGIMPAPGILLSEDGKIEYKYTPGTDGNITITAEDPGKGVAGRQSWRQIR